MNSSIRFRTTSGHSLLHGRIDKVFPVPGVAHVLLHGMGAFDQDTEPEHDDGR